MALKGVNNRTHVGGGMQITFKIDGVEKCSQEFKDARKELRRDARRHVIDQGEISFLPGAKSVVPTMVKAQVIVRATGTRGYLTVKGKRLYDRVLGFWNFGGTVKTVVKPVNAQALTIGPGIFRAAVNNPRRQRGTHKLERVVDTRLPHFMDGLRQRFMHAFDGLDWQ